LLHKLQRFEEKNARKILAEIINGYLDIVAHNIIHRDLKPSNIFMKNGVAKIADFGFAIEKNAPSFHIFYNVGSPNYMSP